MTELTFPTGRRRRLIAAVPRESWFAMLGGAGLGLMIGLIALSILSPGALPLSGSWLAVLIVFIMQALVAITGVVQFRLNRAAAVEDLAHARAEQAAARRRERLIDLHDSIDRWATCLNDMTALVRAMVVHQAITMHNAGKTNLEPIDVERLIARVLEHERPAVIAWNEVRRLSSRVRDSEINLLVSALDVFERNLRNEISGHAYAANWQAVQESSRRMKESEPFRTALTDRIGYLLSADDGIAAAARDPARP